MRSAARTIGVIDPPSHDLDLLQLTALAGRICIVTPGGRARLDRTSAAFAGKTRARSAPCRSAAMDSSFGILDAFAFVVFAVLIAVAVVVIVNLGRLPGRLACRWGHPQASAVNVASWIGMATGGLLWPLALIWAFISASRASRFESDQHGQSVTELDAATKEQAPARKLSAQDETRP